MIIHDVEQGSIHWLYLKLGRLSASEMEKVVTPTGKPSTQVTKLAYKLATERLLNEQMGNIDFLEAIARGKELEPEARRAYTLETGLEVTPVGFVTTDDGEIGASPDGLVNDNGKRGGVEIKCPNPMRIMEWINEGFGKDYQIQVQSQMYVGELDFVDRWGYHPQCPSVFVRTYRDEKLIKIIADESDKFLDLLAGVIAKAERAGPWVASEKLRTIEDREQVPQPEHKDYVMAG